MYRLTSVKSSTEFEFEETGRNGPVFWWLLRYRVFGLFGGGAALYSLILDWTCPYFFFPFPGDVGANPPPPMLWLPLTGGRPPLPLSSAAAAAAAASAAAAAAASRFLKDSFFRCFKLFL